MKVSLNWVKEYTKIDLPVDDLVQKIGAQLGAVEEVVSLGEKYKDIVIAKVVSCEKHPNADKLQVCTIDDGGNTPDVKRDPSGHIQVVCGAPNVEAGLTVAWIPPGATVPSTFAKDPLVLKARELRGVVSNGMLASGIELDINDDHTGIVKLNTAKPGTSFAEAFGLNDHIIDIENKMFTHRPDCFGILGVAREIAGITGQKFESPSWYLEKPEFPKTTQLPLSVKNDLPKLVPRFTAIAMSGVEVKSSPMELQVELMKVGLKPINNVVDATNYLMYLTGQPLHAYDYDKVAATSAQGAELVIRHAKKGEKIRLLNGKTIEPRPEAIMIASSKDLVGIGGVMGGADTEVDKNTKNIILECANFDMYSIRRTSMAHGLFTDAVTRFNKGQSPLQNRRVIGKAVEAIQELAGAQLASPLTDLASLKDTNAAADQWANKEVTVTGGFVNSRLGLDLQAEDIAKLLKNVEFNTDVKGDKLTVHAPFWRTDIEIPEDIVEEVGRLYGYDKLPTDLPNRPAEPVQPDKTLKFKSQLRNKLAALGANETLTYSFVHGDLLAKTGQDEKLAYKLSNALSPDLQYYRLSLTPSLLAHIHQNIKSGYGRFDLFEIGKGHNKLHKTSQNGVPEEDELLALVYADNSKKAGAAYYNARNYLGELAESLGVKLTYKPVDKEDDHPINKPFEPKRSALVCVEGADNALGVVGEFRASVRKQLKLPDASAGFEIDIQQLLKARPNGTNYQPLSRFPSISQDICLQVSSEVSYGQLTTELEQALASHSKGKQKVTFNPIDIYSAEDLKGQKRVTYRITLTNYQRTLTEDLLSQLLQETAAKLGKSLGAKRI